MTTTAEDNLSGIAWTGEHSPRCFDRLLVAQALCEPLRLITHDKRVAAYSPHFILA